MSRSFSSGGTFLHRSDRTLASYRQGEQQARAEARQCQQEKERLLAAGREPGGSWD
jgi:hypothetical protein